VPLKTVRAIEIEQFIRRDERVDGTIRFVKQAYYVEPDKIGQKAFTLLRSVLADKGLTAICKVVIKDREALAALDPFADTMVLTTLHWPDEIRAVADLDLPTDEFEFKPAERAMAEQLIEAMTADFEPTQYRDEYREALMAVIEAKVEGRQVVQAAEEPAGTLIDLMAALEASVNAARASRAQPVTVDEARARSRATSGTRAAGGRSGAMSASEPQPTEAAEAAEEIATVEESRPARRRKSA
jgi:DNA end-binding protein Ku